VSAARARIEIEIEIEIERAYTVFDGRGEAAVRVIQPVAATKNMLACERISFGPRARHVWGMAQSWGRGMQYSYTAV
jgi:hypothetical protein